MREGPVSSSLDRLIETQGASTLQLTAIGRQIGWSHRDIPEFQQIRVRGTVSAASPALLRVVRLEARCEEDRLEVEVEVPTADDGNLVRLDLWFEGLASGAPPVVLTHVQLRRNMLGISGPPPAEMPPPPVLPSRTAMDVFRAQEQIQREVGRLSERHVEWNRRVLAELEG